MGNPSASLGAELAGHPSVGGTGGVTVDQGGISPTELCGIVGQELFTRWKWLCDKARAESDPTVCYCPRPGCQAVVLKSEEAKKEDEGTMHESMRECPEVSTVLRCWQAW